MSMYSLGETMNTSNYPASRVLYGVHRVRLLLIYPSLAVLFASRSVAGAIQNMAHERCLVVSDRH